MNNDLQTVNNECNFKRSQILGKGGFAVVYIGNYRGQIVAIKELIRNNGNQANTYFEKEIQIAQLIQQQVYNQNVIQIYDIIYATNNTNICYIIMELCLGSLDSVLKQCRFNRLPIDETLDVAFQVTSGLQVLHQLGITHRDIKPENIFYTLSPQTNKRIYKLADFGISKQETVMASSIGTIIYMAPEMLQIVDNQYNFKVDIWALGCIMHQLLTGTPLFSGNDISNIRLDILSFKSYMDKWRNNATISQFVSEQQAQLINGMLLQDRNQRLELTQIKQYLINMQQPQIRQQQQNIQSVNKDPSKQNCSECGKYQKLFAQCEEQIYQLQNENNEKQKIIEKNGDLENMVKSLQKNNNNNELQQKNNLQCKEIIMLQIDNQNLREKLKQNEQKPCGQCKMLEEQIKKLEEQFKKEKEQIQIINYPQQNNIVQEMKKQSQAEINFQQNEDPNQENANAQTNAEKAEQAWKIRFFIATIIIAFLVIYVIVLAPQKPEPILIGKDQKSHLTNQNSHPKIEKQIPNEISQNKKKKSNLLNLNTQVSEFGDDLQYENQLLYQNKNKKNYRNKAGESKIEEVRVEG